MPAQWTAAASRVAEAEGWNVFAHDGDRRIMVIQRIDETEIFDGDDAAIRHVLECAAAGSVVHTLALRVCVTTPTLPEDA